MTLSSGSLPGPVWIAGCGFIGTALAERLHEEGTAVLGLTHSAASATALRESGAPFPTDHADLGDAPSIAALAERHAQPPAALVHCASSGRGGVERYEAVYFEGCRHLHATFPSALLLFTSSTSVYPQTGGETVTEDSPAEPERDTGRVLRRTEEFVLAHGGIVARLAGLYGPGRSVILRRFLEGTARIEEGPSRFLNTVHRDDVASALVTLLRHSGEARGRIFNVSDGHPTTQRACYEGLAALFEMPLPPTGPPDHGRKRGWTHKAVDNSRLRALGWEPRYPGFLEAVRRDPELVDSIRKLLSNNLGSGPSKPGNS